MKEFLKRHKLIFIILPAGFLYWLFTEITGLYFPCMFRAVTGFFCPGCGLSHFCTDLLHLDFYRAIRENVLVAVLLVIWIPVFIIRKIRMPQCLSNNGGLYKFLVVFSLVITLLFGIIRNIPYFDFLQPVYLK